MITLILILEPADPHQGSSLLCQMWSSGGWLDFNKIPLSEFSCAGKHKQSFYSFILIMTYFYIHVYNINVYVAANLENQLV